VGEVPCCAGGHSGLFCTALALRGSELLIDMADEPEFVHCFFDRLADMLIAKADAWLNLTEGTDVGSLPISDHGIDMPSAERYRTFVLAAVKRALGQSARILAPADRSITVVGVSISFRL